jgi:hypothetical protein
MQTIQTSAGVVHTSYRIEKYTIQNESDNHIYNKCNGEDNADHSVPIPNCESSDSKDDFGRDDELKT